MDDMGRYASHVTEMLMKRMALSVVSAVILAAAAFSAGWLLHANRNKQGRLPLLGEVPDYTLTNQLGQAVSSASFHHKVRVVSFLFTYCRGYCPLIARNFMTLERVLEAGGMADQVQLITFNVDPEGTGPAQMKAFQQQYGWDPNNRHWQYLTGSPEEIHHIVTDVYHVYYKKIVDDGNDEVGAPQGTELNVVPEPVVSNKLADEAGVDYDIVHNDLIAIVDTRGRIRKIFGDADRVSDEQMMDVIHQLLPEDKPKTSS